MPLSDFPPELLLKIAIGLDAVETNALACTNRGLHNLLNEGLYCRDVTQHPSKSLIWAAENGVEGTIQWAIDAAQKFNLISESFHIALQVAARRGHVPIVELLLKVHGIDPNFQGRHRRDFTPLMYACWQGHISIVQQLLARNDVDLNVRGHHRGTPLILACRRGHLEIINLLLAKDSININLVDRAMECALGVAASQGDVDAIKLLLDHPDADHLSMHGPWTDSESTDWWFQVRDQDGVRYAFYRKPYLS
ncbi:Ankyrin repeat-containing domain protein [Elaphomyces granulatus]